MSGRLERYGAACACGNVRFEAIGDPFFAAACYCSDCREAAAKVAALPGAPLLAEGDGGTQCLLYRKDRIACTTGEDRLIPLKLSPKSKTKRLVASCCNSAMVMAFDDSRHWVSAYRRRFEGDPPPIEARICMGEPHEAEVTPNDAPGFARYPARMMLRLLGARLTMAFRKGETVDG